MTTKMASTKSVAKLFDAFLADEAEGKLPAAKRVVEPPCEQLDFESLKSSTMLMPTKVGFVECDFVEKVFKQDWTGLTGRPREGTSSFWQCWGHAKCLYMFVDGFSHDYTAIRIKDYEQGFRG